MLANGSLLHCTAQQEDNGVRAAATGTDRVQQACALLLLLLHLLLLLLQVVAVWSRLAGWGTSAGGCHGKRGREGGRKGRVPGQQEPPLRGGGSSWGWAISS